jgi:uncharacterized membrane protein (TIGR02234 family)
MIRRARLIAVLAAIAVGALGVISSTQTWLVVTLDDGGRHELAVTGAAAVPVLAPLSLAVLALGAALSIVGLVLRYVFGVLTVAIAGAVGLLSAQVAFATPVSAVASTVTAATGIAGLAAVDTLVATITATGWPGITVVTSALLLGAGVLILVTARQWGRSGRRFQSDADAPTGPDSEATASRPPDAIDSWDDLSRGTDPTADPTAGPR